MEQIAGLLMLIALISITVGGFIGFSSFYAAIIWMGMGASGLLPTAEKYIKIGAIILSIGGVSMITSLTIAHIFEISLVSDNQ